MREQATWRTVVPPIHQASTFAHETTQAMDDWYEGREPGYHYTRYGNPTLDDVQRDLARLEGTDAAVVTASGMSAIATTLLALTKRGDRIVSVAGVYGGTHKLLTHVLPRYGVTTDFVPVDDVEALSAALREPAAVVYLETPTNPALKVCDLAASAEAARRAGATSVCDNTFASPVLTRPRELGVDVVVESATKYLGGHSDVTAGVVAADADTLGPVLGMARVLGPTLDPHAAFLLRRGLRTLHLRVPRQSANAQHLAERLQQDARVLRVHYPGLPTHHGHDVAKRQMTGGFGGVVSFDLASREEAWRFLDALEVFHNAPSLGGVESLATSPIVSSHRGVPPEDLALMGVTPGTVRLACGVDDAPTLAADVLQALDRATSSGGPHRAP